MNKKNISLYYIFFLLSCFAFGDDMYNKNKIIGLIKDVPTEVHLTIIWDLKESKSFLELEKCSGYLKDIALELLETNELKDSEKEVVVYAMQNIPFNDYKYFLLNLATDFQNNKISEHFLDICLFPRGWRNVVVENYDDKVLSEVFRICLKNKLLSRDLKKNIILAMKGKLQRKND